MAIKQTDNRARSFGSADSGEQDAIEPNPLRQLVQARSSRISI
jgi:hypothetical protein